MNRAFGKGIPGSRLTAMIGPQELAREFDEQAAETEKTAARN